MGEKNAAYLDGNIKQLSFKEIRNPTFEINNTLHDLREDLAKLKSGLSETIAWADKVVPTWSHKELFFKESLSRQTPILTLQHILDQTTPLEAFLMQTFQIFMSSISIKDSQASIEQTKRATMLTQLAFIYIPLSFVTSVFGMDIKELNGSGLHIWVFFVGLAISIGLTTAVFLGLNYYKKEKEIRKRRVDSMA